jgi:hypothetical protein
MIRLRPSSKRLIRERGYIYAPRDTIDLTEELAKLAKWQEANK